MSIKPGDRLHRNNLAERVMVILLTPVAWMIRGWKTVRSFCVGKNPASTATGVKKQPPPRRPVVIEGLPPRTLN